MNLNTPNFLFLFFPIFFLLYFLAGYRGRLILGIAGSVFFYSWGSSHDVYLILALTVFAYFTGSFLNRWRSVQKAVILLWLGIVLILGLLLFFKLDNETTIPLGLSYVSFQIIAYFVDVNKKEGEFEKDFLKFSFYLLLFPKLPVGPIIRYSQVKGQISDLKLESQSVLDGLRRFLLGFAKKALIADTLAKVVVPVFNLQSPVISPSIAWLVIISYSLQLYYDFSGLTDMAIGAGRMMGVQFIENFNHPYISRSISDFWRRWHISLSSWFRDYVFYPLERKRLRWLGQPINILLVFFLTGLWHGVTRNFIIWGLLHGFALVFEATSLGRRVRALWMPFQHFYALSVVVVGWIFFRSPTPDFALDYLRRLAGDVSGMKPLPFELTSPLPIIEPTFVLAFVLGLLFCLPIGEWINAGIRKMQVRRTFALRVAGDIVLVFLFIAGLASTAGSTYTPGIYGGF